MPLIDFGRDICNNYAVSSRKEWLVTNGIGSYASGTVAGVLTRRYHGLLLAALKPPLGRTLLITKFNETIDFDGQRYPIYLRPKIAIRNISTRLSPAGTILFERFHPCVGVCMCRGSPRETHLDAGRREYDLYPLFL